MVGVVGSAAPWFLTGWTNDVEVEFMIDTGCQVTISATSVFEKMCKVHPQVKSRLSLCTRQLVSADLSPLTVVGRINLNVAFPGLQCNMCCVVANIGSDGLLGTEALQLCLPHQLDLQTGQFYMVLPPDSEVVGIAKLIDVYNIQLCKLMYSYTSGTLLTPLKTIFISNSAVHIYETRHAADPHVAVRKTSIAARTFRPNKLTLVVLVGARTTFSSRTNFFFFKKKKKKN